MANNFDVLKKMSAENMDIRAFPTIVSARMVGGNGKVEIGTDAKTAFDLLSNGKMGAMLIVWDAEQFNKAKVEMEAAQGRGDLDLDIDDGC